MSILPAALLCILAAPPHPWRADAPVERTVASIPAPEGYTRVGVDRVSFGAWLRGLPLRTDRVVRLFDGRTKGNQAAQHAVIDIDVGTKDLQQCADAVMRLRAEYLRAAGREDDVCFRFTSGDAAWWKDWKRGVRPIVSKRVRFEQRADPDGSYSNFRSYLEKVFMYAGSASLTRELVRVPDWRRIEPGDVVIQGGFPGHAVIVVDVAENARGERVFLLAQSYMPAQDIHVVVNPSDAGLSPWYRADGGARLTTAEWDFREVQVKRFPRRGCGKR